MDLTPNETKPAQPKMQEKKESSNPLKDEIKTSVRKFSDKVREKLEQMEDLATLELSLPVHIRMKHRMDSIRKMSQAQHLKIDGRWKTRPPKIHIRGLEGRKMSQSEAEVRFMVYEMDDKGNKVLKEHYAKEQTRDGNVVERLRSAEYPIAYEVVERILHKKPVTREVMYVNEAEQ